MRSVMTIKQMLGKMNTFIEAKLPSSSMTMPMFGVYTANTRVVTNQPLVMRILRFISPFMNWSVLIFMNSAYRPGGRREEAGG